MKCSDFHSDLSRASPLEKNVLLAKENSYPKLKFYNLTEILSNVLVEERIQVLQNQENMYD